MLVRTLNKAEEQAISSLEETIGNVCIILVFGSKLFKVETKDIDVIYVSFNKEFDNSLINKKNKLIQSTMSVNIHPFVLSFSALLEKLSKGDPQVLTFLSHSLFLKDKIFSKKFIKNDLKNIKASTNVLNEILNTALNKINMEHIESKDYFFAFHCLCQAVCGYCNIIPKYPNMGLPQQTIRCIHDNHIKNIIKSIGAAYKNKSHIDYNDMLKITTFYNFCLTMIKEKK